MTKEHDEIQELIVAGQYSKAEECARSLIELQPEDLEARIILAETLMYQDNYSAAYDLLRKMSLEHEDNPDVFWFLGFACEYEKHFDEAIEAFKKGLSLGNRTSLIHYNLGRLYNSYEYKSRNREAAQRHLRYATTGNDPVPEAFLELARFEFGERGIYVLRNAVRRFPSNHKIHERLCWRLYYLGHWTDCLAAVEAARTAGAKSNDLRLVSALAQFRLKEYSESLNELRKLDATDERVTTAVKCFEGICRLEADELDNARQILHAVIAEDFSNTLDFAAHLILICCYLQAGDIEGAEVAFDEIPQTHRFFDPLFLSILNFEDFEIAEYLTRALNGFIKTSTRTDLVAKARVFRSSYLYERRDENTKQQLTTIRDDLLAGLKEWPLDVNLNSRASDVMADLKDWISAARYHFASTINEPNEDAYYLLNEQVLESIYLNQSLWSRFFSIIDETIRETYTRGRERFAKRSLEQIVEFLHGKQQYSLLISLAEKFTYDELRSADVLFEVAYAYVETGNKKRGKTLYKAHLSDVGPNSAIANNLALLEEQSGNLLEAQRLLEIAIEQDSGNERFQKNVERVREELKKLDDQKRAMQKAADLYLHEDDRDRLLIAQLHAGKTADDLILCNPKKLAGMMGTRVDKAEQRLTEFIHKRYFEEVLDSAIAFHGKVLRANSVIVPYLQEETRAAEEAAYVSEVAGSLSSRNLDEKYGYNKQLLADLAFVHSSDLSRMLERDLREAVTALITGSHKSALVLCGSLAEAMLLDQLMAERKLAIKAIEDILSASGERAKAEDRRIDRWTLDRLLDVSLRLQIISTNLYHWGHGIRDFRNLVHPAAERRKSIEVSAENAQMAWNVVKRLIRELSQGHEKKESGEVALSATST